MDSKSLEQQLQDAGLVEIKDPHFIIDLMYARANNMSGCAAYREIGLGNLRLCNRAMKPLSVKILSEPVTIICRLLRPLWPTAPCSKI